MLSNMHNFPSFVNEIWCVCNNKTLFHILMIFASVITCFSLFLWLFNHLEDLQHKMNGFYFVFCFWLLMVVHKTMMGTMFVFFFSFFWVNFCVLLCIFAYLTLNVEYTLVFFCLDILLLFVFFFFEYILYIIVFYVLSCI